MIVPQETECVTCGGVARRAAWGSCTEPCYRCTECFAGGHIAIDGDDVVKQGGVFERLNNHVTRGMDA